MGSYVLALNCGSSSLKFTLFEMEEGNKLDGIIEGVVEEIGNLERSRIKMLVDDKKEVIDIALPSHKEALLHVFEKFNEHSIKKRRNQRCWS